MKRELFLKNTIAARNTAFAKFMDRSSHLIDMKRGNTVLTVNQQKIEIWKKSLYCVFWILIILDQGDGTTLCTQASASYSLPVASLCYQTSASASRVVLDGFLTFQSSVTTCECTITSSKSTTVSFMALNNLHPMYVDCGSAVRVVSGGTSFVISCYVTGTVRVSPSQPVTLSFAKPDYIYNSGYCMLLNSDNVSAVLTLKCNGDLSYPMPTVIPSTTLSTRATTTTLPSKTLTTPAQTTIRTTTQRTTPTTTTQTTTKITIPRLTTATTTTTFLSAVTTITAILSPLSTTTAQLPTTKQYSTAIYAESSTSSMWNQTIPAIGAGIVLICVIVLVVCFRYRRKYKTPSNDRTVVYVNETKVNLPYSPDYKYEEGSLEIACESSAHIYDVIL